MIDPKDAEAWARLGIAASQQDDLPAALEAFRHAAGLEPANADYRFAHAAVLQAMGRTDEAERGFCEAALARWKAAGAPSAPEADGPRLGLGWKPGNSSGWEVYGANIVKELKRRGTHDCVLLDPAIALPVGDELVPGSLAVAAPALAAGKPHDFPMLVALGNDFARFPVLGRSIRTIGIMFLEHTELSVEGREDSRRFELVIAGSRWCGEILESFGLDNVETIIQGVDPELFHWRERPPRRGAFRIFSGGKLEYRKGQDIVIEAFKRFRTKHAEAKLVTCWNSAVPQAAASIEWGGLVTPAPALDESGGLDLVRWLDQLGLPQDSVEVLGVVPNQRMPEVLASVDVALFPNRCEGGTNLPAMEAMAMGVPTILSANTGHLDLIEPGNCLPLQRQWRVHAPMVPGTEGWGDSDVDEAVEALERVYGDPGSGTEIGRKGAATLSGLSWSAQIAKLLAAIG